MRAACAPFAPPAGGASVGGEDGLLEPIEAYLVFLQLERGLSSHSVDGYRRDLFQAARFIARKHHRARWSAVTAADLSTWMQSLGAENLAPSSLARKRSALRGFFRYLLKEQVCSSDPTELLVSPKRVRRLPGTLTPEEVTRLLDAPQGGDAYALRDKAILELFYSSGLRISELSALTLQQIDLEHGWVRVLGKGAKERIVPMGERAARALAIYVESGRSHFAKPSRTRSHLFLSERGGPLSRVMLWVLVKRYARIAGITRPVKPHLLRHSFATHLLKGGADLRAIQEMLGHANVSTTEIYTAVESSRIVEHHRRYHPRGRRVGTGSRAADETP